MKRVRKIKDVKVVDITPLKDYVILDHFIDIMQVVGYLKQLDAETENNAGYRIRFWNNKMINKYNIKSFGFAELLDVDKPLADENCSLVLTFNRY